MNTQYRISSLDKESVSLDLIRTIEVNGQVRSLPRSKVEYRIADIEKVKSEVPKPELDAILSVWESADLEPEVLSEDSVSTKYSITYLTPDSVSILRQQFVSVDGMPVQVDSDWRCAYSNSPRGRSDLQENVLPQYVNSVFAVWGSKPTIADHDWTSYDENGVMITDSKGNLVNQEVN